LTKPPLFSVPFHRLALGISLLAGASAIGLLATFAVAFLSSTVDQVWLELPVGIFGFWLLPILSSLALAAGAVACRWYSSRTSTVATCVAESSFAVGLGFVLWV
jgi:hypothetical protein